MSYHFVSTHSRPKAAEGHRGCHKIGALFQHTAARRRLPAATAEHIGLPLCFNTQPPEGGCGAAALAENCKRVSTHSRPKAAETTAACSPPMWTFQHTAARRRLAADERAFTRQHGFNTQPPEGGCEMEHTSATLLVVSTHSRPKAADPYSYPTTLNHHVSTHSRPKAADRLDEATT